MTDNLPFKHPPMRGRRGPRRGWTEGLAERGVEVVDAGADLAVASSAAALPRGSDFAIVERVRGEAGKLAVRGYDVTRLLTVPPNEHLRLLVSLDHPRAAYVALRHLAPARRTCSPGELLRPPVLFDWVRRHVSALGLSPGSVGPLLTLHWLHSWAGAADRWLNDPQPGLGWSSWIKA